MGLRLQRVAALGAVDGDGNHGAVAPQVEMLQRRFVERILDRGHVSPYPAEVPAPITEAPRDTQNQGGSHETNRIPRRARAVRGTAAGDGRRHRRVGCRRRHRHRRGPELRPRTAADRPVQHGRLRAAHRRRDHLLRVALPGRQGSAARRRAAAREPGGDGDLDRGRQVRRHPDLDRVHHRLRPLPAPPERGSVDGDRAVGEQPPLQLRRRRDSALGPGALGAERRGRRVHLHHPQGVEVVGRRAGHHRGRALRLRGQLLQRGDHPQPADLGAVGRRAGQAVDRRRLHLLAELRQALRPVSERAHRAGAGTLHAPGPLHEAVPHDLHRHQGHRGGHEGAGLLRRGVGQVLQLLRRAQPDRGQLRPHALSERHRGTVAASLERGRRAQPERVHPGAQPLLLQDRPDRQAASLHRPRPPHLRHRPGGDDRQDRGRRDRPAVPVHPPRRLPAVQVQRGEGRLPHHGAAGVAGPAPDLLRLADARGRGVRRRSCRTSASGRRCRWRSTVPR